MKLVVFVVLMFSAAGVFAKGGGGVRKMLRELDLSEEQRAKIKAIHKKQKSHMGSSRDDIASRERRLHEELKSGQKSDAELQQMHDEILALQQKKKKERFASMLEIRRILSPEQRVQFAEMHEKRGPRRGKGQRIHSAPVKME